MDNDPARTDEHPLSEKQTNTEHSKLATTVAMVTDPTFPVPMIEQKTPITRQILSVGTLLLLIAGGVVGAWLLDTELLQSSQPVLVLSIAFAGLTAALWFTGTVWIDWYELVLGYWWLSMPIGALTGLALVMNQEASTAVEHVA